MIYRLLVQTIFPSTILCLGVLSCTKATSASEAQQNPATAVEDPQMRTQAIPASAEAKQPVDDSKWTKDIKGISLTGLKADNLTAFLQITNEEVCPCACEMTWAQCIADTATCPSALPLAEWLRDMLLEGFPADQLAEVLTQEIVSFSGQPQKIDIDGYAHKQNLLVDQKQPEFTVVEYADFQCPHCKELGHELDKMMDSKKYSMKVVFKHFPLSFHDMAEPAAIAVEAAGKQGRFWDMHDIVYKTQDILDLPTLKGHAKVLKLDMTRFEKDFSDPKTKALVQNSRKSGESLGIEGTPAVYINGRSFNLLREEGAFQVRFAMERSRGKGACLSGSAK